MQSAVCNYQTQLRHATTETQKRNTSIYNHHNHHQHDHNHKPTTSWIPPPAPSQSSIAGFQSCHESKAPGCGCRSETGGSADEKAKRVQCRTCKPAGWHLSSKECVRPAPATFKTHPNIPQPRRSRMTWFRKPRSRRRMRRSRRKSSPAPRAYMKIKIHSHHLQSLQAWICIQTDKPC